ncbi:glycosyltransferase [Nitratifractor sp.]
MKLAFVIYNLARGGAERVVATLSRELSREHEVHIITFDHETAYEYGGKHINLNIPASRGNLKKAFNVLRRAQKLRRLFAQEGYDRIYALMESAYTPAILTGVPVIASVRNKVDRSTEMITRHLLPKAKMVIAVSEEMARMMKRDYGLNNVVSIPNPLDFSSIDDADAPCVISSGFVMAMGRLHDQKGFDILISAYAASKWCCRKKLLIVGEGSLREGLMAEIRKRKLEEWIELPGIVENPYPLLKAADCFILSSRYEGYPNVLIEALACGTPVLATDCPTGPREIVQDGINGLLVENERVDCLVEAMNTLAENPEMLENMRANARQTVEHLNVKNLAERWLNL